MDEQAGVIDPQHWSRPVRVAALIGVLVGFGLAVQVSLRSGDPDVVGVIWLGNGAQLGVVLLLARRWWPTVLASCAAVSTVLLLVAGRSPILAVGATAANLIVVLTAARGLAPHRDWVTGRVNGVADWFWFGFWAVIVAPVVGAVLGAVTTILAHDLPATSEVAWSTGSVWYLADAVGMCVIVPAALRLRPASLVDAWRRHPAYEAVAVAAAMVTVLVVVFSHPSVVAIYLIVPVLIVVVFRYGFVGMATTTIVLAATVLGFTQAGDGPFVAMVTPQGPDAMTLAQVFVLGMFSTQVLIAALDEQSRRHALMEEISEEAYELLATASGATIFVADPDGWTRYVSANVAGLLGLFASQLVGEGWVRHIHPDDELDARRGAARVDVDGREFVFRMRHVDGTWRWMEASIRSSERRDRRGMAVQVGMIRDVTERVSRERALQNANVQLAEDAATDPLTGLANRRRFSDERTSAWRRSIVSEQPISLLLVDIDNFKSYNDRYGHASGDECLRAVAEAIEGTVRQPSDVCARYGGEEFVLLLPATDRQDALMVANRVRDAVRRRRVEHAGSPHGLVTVSVGVATMQPEVGDEFGRLFEAADAAMYRSKRHGRDRVETDDALSHSF